MWNNALNLKMNLILVYVIIIWDIYTTAACWFQTSDISQTEHTCDFELTVSGLFFGGVNNKQHTVVQMWFFVSLLYSFCNLYSLVIRMCKG